MHRHSLVWLAIFIVIALMFLRLPQMSARQSTVLSTYGSLVEVDALAKQKYVERIAGERLVDGAIRGMLRELDPYSGYVSASELAAFERRSNGEYIGVGIEVGLDDGRLKVIAPVEGSPAARAGILAGDTILAVDGRNVKDHSAFDVEELLGGEPGTKVRLTVVHRGSEEPTTVDVVRGPVSLMTVRGARRERSGQWVFLIDEERRIGYIRVSSFLNNTVRAFDNALSQLTGGGMRGLVIDLRFNPGGIMPQAVAMVDRFVDRGVILTTVTRRKAVRRFPATKSGTLGDIPLVVLINGASASSSEIVAGALQALGRATVIGERSFGKGSVQELIELSEHRAAVKLTTAYYRLPDGRIIHRTDHNTTEGDWGVIPDIEVRLDADEVEAIRRSRERVDHSFGKGGRVEVGATPGDSSALNPSPSPEESGSATFGLSGRSGDGSALGAKDGAPTPAGSGVIVDRQLQSALERVRQILEQGG
ncbi:MAG: S41 family peptidase [Phycisphaerae bacterium]|jgi:carboxyl-terminal processing protease